MRIFILFCIILLLPQIASAQSVITIEVQSDGNALWTVEEQQPLTTQSEISEWGSMVQGQELRSKRDLAKFMNKMNQSLRTSQNSSNRSMTVEQFNVTYDMIRTLSGSIGIIRYRFEWKNFSRTDSNMIFIGDVFSEGLLLPSAALLIIQTPDDYEVVSASPEFDKRSDNRLIWEGKPYRSFGKGEPALVLSPDSPVPWIYVGVVLGILTLGAGMLVWKKVHISAKSDIPSKQFPVFEEEGSRDEEMIKNLLINAGGHAYQSDIVKQSGHSKSKISIILTKMKEKGHIVKIRRGKENLIKLMEPPRDK